MRLHALLGVLAAISCARQATAWDYTCWDCVAFRASLWLPFSEGDIQSRQWAVAAKMAADQFNARNGSIVAEFAKLPPACTFKFSVDVSHFSAMTRPTWLGRAARNRHDSRTGEQLGLGAAAPDEARLRRVCAPLGIHAKHGTECAVSVALAGRGVHLKAEDAFRNLTLVRPPVEVSSPRRLEVLPERRRLKSCADTASFDPSDSCWEIHS